MPNEIDSFLDPRNVIVGLEASCKRSALEKLALHARDTMGLDQTGLLDTLLEREQLGTTGIGSGVAVPHARAELGQLKGVLARLASPIDFDAIDARPVDLIFLLVAPEAASAEHLKALSRVARLVRAESTQEAMRGATDAASLYAIAVGAANAQAA